METTMTRNNGKSTNTSTRADGCMIDLVDHQPRRQTVEGKMRESTLRRCRKRPLLAMGMLLSIAASSLDGCSAAVLRDGGVRTHEADDQSTDMKDRRPVTTANDIRQLQAKKRGTAAFTRPQSRNNRDGTHGNRRATHNGNRRALQRGMTRHANEVEGDLRELNADDAQGRYAGTNRGTKGSSDYYYSIGVSDNGTNDDEGAGAASDDESTAEFNETKRNKSSKSSSSDDSSSSSGGGNERGKGAPLPKSKTSKSAKSSSRSQAAKPTHAPVPPPTRPPTRAPIPSPTQAPITGPTPGCVEERKFEFFQLAALIEANQDIIGTQFIFNDALFSQTTLDEIPMSGGTGVCSRHQNRFDLGNGQFVPGGGICTFSYTFVEEDGTTLQFSASGDVYDGQGGTILPITGGSRGLLGAYGEIELIPVSVVNNAFVPNNGDFFQDPTGFLADASVFVPCAQDS